jgi:hypothetical protein
MRMPCSGCQKDLADIETDVVIVSLRVGIKEAKIFLCPDCVDRFRKNTVIRMMIESKLSPEWRSLLYG